MSLATPERKPSLAEIARRVGVSTPTVSKVLNERADVAPDTRAKVLAALEDAGYESPVQRRSARDLEAVEVVFDSITTSYAISLLNGILHHAAAADVEVILNAIGSSPSGHLDLNRKAQRVIDERRAGIIFVTSAFNPSDLSAFRRRQIPVVVVDPLNPPPSDVVSVGATNFAGGREATEHLLELGHRRIGYLGGRESNECNQARLHGYMSALTASGVDVDPELVIHGSFRAAHGIAGTSQLLDLAKPPTAIFAGNDTVAIGVLREARRRRVRVPEDLSLVGFDGTALAEESVPALTSVAQPLEEMGRVAMRSVLRQSRGELIDSHRVELATQLVVRESTARLRPETIADLPSDN